MPSKLTMTIPKLVTSNISRWKEKLSKKNWFPENKLHLQLLCEVPHSTIFFMQHRLLSLTIRKPTTTAIQNPWTFDQYIFYSMSNMHVCLVHWNSQHLIKAIKPTFFFRTYTKKKFVENHNTRTNNLHHQKSGSVGVVLYLARPPIVSKGWIAESTIWF